MSYDLDWSPDEIQDELDDLNGYISILMKKLRAAEAVVEAIRNARTRLSHSSLCSKTVGPGYQCTCQVDSLFITLAAYDALTKKP